MFKIVQGAKLYELVIEQIKYQILRGAYKRGDMLPSEKELMASTKVSRITVREALRILASAGVIETIQGKGSRVLIDGIDLARQQDLHFREYQERFMNATRARLLLEPEIAKYVAEKASPENIERICDVLAFQNFHRAIVVATANPYLVDLFDRIFDDEILPEGTTLIPPYLQKDTHEQIEAQHRKIAEAIRERNGEFAYFYMKEHTLFIHSIYQEHFERFA